MRTNLKAIIKKPQDKRTSYDFAAVSIIKDSRRRWRRGGVDYRAQRSRASCAASSFGREEAGRWAWRRAFGTEDGAGTGRRHGAGAAGVDRGERLMAMVVLRWQRRLCSSDGDGGAAVGFDSLTASLQNPPVSTVTLRGVVLYIGGTFLVSVILMCPTPKIVIFGVNCLYTVGTYDYLYRLY
jgi:hypothetical protein